MRGEWSGDADLDSGDLQFLYKEYQSRRLFTKNIAVGRRTGLRFKEIKKQLPGRSDISRTRRSQ